MQHNQFLLIIKCSIINKNTGSLCCTLETNTTLQINSIQLRETENGKILTLGYLICLLSILALFSIKRRDPLRHLRFGYFSLQGNFIIRIFICILKHYTSSFNHSFSILRALVSLVRTLEGRKLRAPAISSMLISS